ncbi:head-tail connector protein [Alteriqipengyuania flavescens]|uniref:head-tail connector protein n=1 Tax=Alteriqipengyuania flavescens TaxID=3053610 RepID=UPI0025B4B445|nr:head-tail connector protein [Alteriqipengyuania flavescens]WJY17494.1 head-tail connector protein [Alteriqipengyuania flavescens]WJY23437.1 head-tail connector protein [Alteriqipengyuania flavescens]
MPDLVTLAEAKEFIRVMADDEDATIAILVSSASDAVRAVADAWDGVGEVPPRLKLAVLSRVAVAFDERTDVRAALGEDRLIGPYRSLSV